MPRFLRNTVFLSIIAAAPVLACAAADVDTYTISLNSDAITGFAHTMEMVPATPSVDRVALVEGATGTASTFEDLNTQADPAQSPQPSVQAPSAASSDRVTLNLHENGTYNLYSNARADFDSAAPASLMPVPLALVLILGTGMVAFAGTARRKLLKR